MTPKKWVHDPIILGNDPIVQGSWRLQVEIYRTCTKPEAGRTEVTIHLQIVLFATNL